VLVSPEATSREAAVEVGEEEFGAVLVTVEADDAEVFGTDFLDAGMQDAAGLAEGVARWAGLASAGTDSSHETSLQKKDGAHLILAAGAPEWYFFIKTNIPGVLSVLVGRRRFREPGAPPLEKSRPAFSATDDFTGKDNPQFRLSGYSHGSSNHLAQDLAVFLQMSWLLLKVSAPRPIQGNPTP